MKKNIYFYETNTPIGKIGIATTENDSHITALTWDSDFENLVSPLKSKKKNPTLCRQNYRKFRSEIFHTSALIPAKVH